MTIVQHPESGISYCSKHFTVADADGACSTCLAVIPRPPVFVDHTAIRRWHFQINSVTDPDPGPHGAIQRIVSYGRELEGTGRYEDCRYFAHDDYPAAVVVVRVDGAPDLGPAAITILHRTFFERLRAEAKARA